MQIKFLNIAQQELDNTFEYYEAQQKNLGYRFIAEIENTLERIHYNPKAWHPLSKNTRRSLVNKFPYGIIYQIRDEYILVIAIANLHRKPFYWIKRGK